MASKSGRARPAGLLSARQRSQPTRPARWDDAEPLEPEQTSSLAALRLGHAAAAQAERDVTRRSRGAGTSRWSWNTRPTGGTLSGGDVARRPRRRRPSCRRSSHAAVVGREQATTIAQQRRLPAPFGPEARRRSHRPPPAMSTSSAERAARQPHRRPQAAVHCVSPTPPAALRGPPSAAPFMPGTSTGHGEATSTTSEIDDEGQAEHDRRVEFAPSSVDVHEQRQRLGLALRSCPRR